MIGTISKDLNIPEDMIKDTLLYSRKHVKHIKIPKKDGSYRRVYQPSRKLKLVQYWLIKNIFEELKVHPAAMAYRKSFSIKSNVYSHKNRRFFLKLDFKDFFPSITVNDLCPIIYEFYKAKKCAWNIDELLEIIKLSCFYIDDKLPIGYPSSPIISNAVMFNFDSKTVSLLEGQKSKFGEIQYTRYADDLTFSSNRKGVCLLIKQLVEDIIRNLDSPKLTINPEKTRFLSSTGGSAFVTGLRLCYDKHITIHRKYKDRIRLLLSLYDKNTLNESDINTLKGHLSYIRHVDSPFYTKLQKKYFKSITKLFVT